MRDVPAEWRPVVDEELERILPRPLHVAYLSETFGSATFEYDADAIEVAADARGPLDGVDLKPGLAANPRAFTRFVVEREK